METEARVKDKLMWKQLKINAAKFCRQKVPASNPFWDEHCEYAKRLLKQTAACFWTQENCSFKTA